MNQEMTHRPFTDKKGLYEYSSLQINLPYMLNRQIISWGKEKIQDVEVYNPPNDFIHGREDEAHVTILYGIHSQHPEETISLLANQPPFEVSLGAISIFDSNPNFDVVKIDASSPNLFHMNYLIKTNLKNTQKFINYRPHVTIAYVKKGKCGDLAGKADFKGIHWKVNSLIFSSKNGIRTPLRLKHAIAAHRSIQV
jgi:2'-5' RNA ligase superfamily